MATQPASCPLCQHDNRCTRATNSNSTSCWCQTATISPALISQAREKHGEKRCICQQCADLAETLASAPQ